MLDEAEFRRRYGPWAAVAGASEGMGHAFADALAGRRLNVLLIARREGKLAAQAHLLRRRHRVEVHVAPLDLGASDAGSRFERAITGLDLGLVVYNACHATIGPFLSTALADKLATVDVNCRGLAVLASIAAQRLSARGRGGLLLMSSMAGFTGTAWVSTYAATKAFTTVLGEGLWSELGPRGVDVLVCAAGATTTPSFLQQTAPERRAQAHPMTPEQVVAGALSHLDQGPLYIPGAVNRAVYRASKLLSRRAATRLMSQGTRRIYAKNGAP